ncbi:MAG: plastocyanin/azurin family copper-binding protein [Acidimicrobiales bacterium]
MIAGMVVAAVIGALAGLIVLTLMLSESRSTAATTKTIDMFDIKFAVPALTVAPGDTVTWTNSDNVRHTVTSRGGSELASPDIKAGESFSHTFATVGTFNYFCEIHPDMKGTVTVSATAAAAPVAAAPAAIAPVPAPAGPVVVMPVPAAPTPMGGHSSAAKAPAVVPVPAPSVTPPAPSGPASPAAAAPASPTAPCSPTFEPIGPLVKHLQAAHFEESPSQQIADLLDLDQYTLTHTVLVNNMLFGPC